MTATPETPTFKPKKSVALSGVAAGNTALCTVGRTGNDLSYRGYDILDLAQKCEFEEVAYLLIHGHLPNKSELAAYKTKLKSMRGLPIRVIKVLESLPAHTHPMDVLRSSRTRKPSRPRSARHCGQTHRQPRQHPALLVSIFAQRQTHRRRKQGRHHRRPLPAPVARQTPDRIAG